MRMTTYEYQCVSTNLESFAVIFADVLVFLRGLDFIYRLAANIPHSYFAIL